MTVSGDSPEEGDPLPTRGPLRPVQLGDPARIGRATARNRFVFGPHVTNLGRGRRFSERHLAYYRDRAAGGAGVIVLEEASAHVSDWPYERAPLAEECVEGWATISRACQAEGALVLAAIGHAGGQGSSAYHQMALLAPSNVPDVVTREVPKAMEDEDVAAVIAGFSQAAALAAEAGCDGVEVNSGQWSLLRQFCSGLTNARDDDLGTDRSLFLRRVLEAVGETRPGIVGLRFSCDELAPWAGLIPEGSAAILAELSGSGLFDYVTPVRGSAYGLGTTNPDGHIAPGFNRAATALVRSALPASVAVVAQGSIVDVEMAAEIVAGGEADLVEMTRAFIADRHLGRKVLGGEGTSVRPCVLCNQACQVRDPRNPPVSCITDPSAGYEAVEAEPGRGAGCEGSGIGAEEVLVVGGGPAGLECARVAAALGFPVRLLERARRLGGMAEAAAMLPGRARIGRFVAWLAAECTAAGVTLVTDHEATIEELDAHEGPVVCCTGSRPGRRGFPSDGSVPVVTADQLLTGGGRLAQSAGSPAVVLDPVGGPVGVGCAEVLSSLGGEVMLVTPDFVVGEQLARTGDLAPASVRLQQAGVSLLRRQVVRAVEDGRLLLEHRDSGELSDWKAAVLVDAGHRLPEDVIFRAVSASRPGVMAAGDAVAPRSILEAVLEGRRAALGLRPEVGAAR